MHNNKTVRTAIARAISATSSTHIQRQTNIDRTLIARYAAPPPAAIKTITDENYEKLYPAIQSYLDPNTPDVWPRSKLQEFHTQNIRYIIARIRQKHPHESETRKKIERAAIAQYSDNAKDLAKLLGIMGDIPGQNQPIPTDDPMRLYSLLTDTAQARIRSSIITEFTRSAAKKKHHNCDTEDSSITRHRLVADPPTSYNAEIK